VGLRCLIVDDSEEFLASASRLLEAQGLEVVGAVSSGAEAVSLATELRPEVALVDVQLGDEDGFEVTRRLAAAAPSTRVVLISTHPEEDLPELPASAAGFLAKTALSGAAIRELLG
jgi:two-component system, NarL family, nitrate/nitrite response regulator NarL